MQTLRRALHIFSHLIKKVLRGVRLLTEMQNCGRGQGRARAAQLADSEAHWDPKPAAGLWASEKKCDVTEITANL